MIHPTAIIHPGAQLGAGCASRFMSARIGPIVPRSSYFIVPHQTINSQQEDLILAGYPAPPAMVDPVQWPCTSGIQGRISVPVEPPSRGGLKAPSRRWLPGRHLSFSNHQGDIRGPFPGLLKGLQREWTDVMATMAVCICWRIGGTSPVNVGGSFRRAGSSPKDRRQAAGGRRQSRRRIQVAEDRSALA